MSEAEGHPALRVSDGQPTTMRGEGSDIDEFSLYTQHCVKSNLRYTESCNSFFSE